MNIGGIINNQVSTNIQYGKIGTGNNQQKTDKDENNKNNLSSLDFLQINGKKKEVNMATMLMEKKESMQKHIESLQKRLAGIDELKSKLPYEEVLVMEDGKQVIKKVYSDEDLKTLKRLEGQEDSLAEKIKNLTDGMVGLDGEIAAAMAADQSRKLEKEKKEQEEALEKAEGKKSYSKEEQERREQVKQNEFLIQSDSVKKYVQDGRATKARLEQQLTRKEQEMATDALNTATMDQSALHHEFPISESPVPDTSMFIERDRIVKGKLNQTERRESGAILDKLEAAINRTQEFINTQMGKINNEAEELRTDKEEVVKEKEVEKVNNEEDHDNDEKPVDMNI